MILSTLVYIENAGQYLMLHRTKKKNDINQDKWIGIGGKFEAGESPEDCLLREVREETGLALTAWQFCGIVTFVPEGGETEYMHLFTAKDYTGELLDCDEGELAWIDCDALYNLTLWEGDRIFLRLLRENRPFFSLKLCYQGDKLTEAVLDGEKLERIESKRGEYEWKK